MCANMEIMFLCVSKPREGSKTFKKLPASVKESRKLEYLFFFKQTWTQVGEIKYSDTISEVFDVQIIQIYNVEIF